MIRSTIELKPIGWIQSPFKDIRDMPIQPSGADGVQGKLILLPEYVDGLADLDGFSHIYLIYIFHKIRTNQLTVTPFLNKDPKGIFSTRAPTRPNPIGLSVVKLIKIEGNTLFLENIDVLDSTPVIDIKPYVPSFDQPSEVRVGWVSESGEQVKSKRSDNRFREID